MSRINMVGHFILLSPMLVGLLIALFGISMALAISDVINWLRHRYGKRKAYECPWDIGLK